MLVKQPGKLRELYQKHGSTKQWENVVLFVNYFQNVEKKDAVTYQDIRRAYKALGIKAPNIQASANSLKVCALDRATSITGTWVKPIPYPLGSSACPLGSSACALASSACVPGVSQTRP